MCVCLYVRYINVDLNDMLGYRRYLHWQQFYYVTVSNYYVLCVVYTKCDGYNLLARILLMGLLWMSVKK